MQQRIFDLLLQQEDVTWKTLLYDLVKEEQMDPWDINVTLLTHKYIELIKGMKEHDFRISGKILLAAAILLKIKSTHLVENDIAQLDQLINETEEEVLEEELFDELHNEVKKEKQTFQLIPRNPQPRNRKVSIEDLTKALQRAMASKRRFLERQRPRKFTVPKRKIDIGEVIRDVFHKINYYTKKQKKKSLSFQKLLPPKAGKKETVYTFLPLLHLENQEKIVTEQEKAFADIKIKLK